MLFPIVWFTMMLPLLKSRHYAHYSVTYLSQLLELHRDTQEDAISSIAVKDFFALFDVVFSTDKVLPTNIHSDLTVLYPEIKVQTWPVVFSAHFGCNEQFTVFQKFVIASKPVLVNFFPSFLKRF